MKRAFLYVIGAISILSLTGCGDFVNSLRRESRAVDAEAERDRDDNADQSQGYRPKILHGLSANNVAEYQAPNARNYAGRKLAGRRAVLPDEDSQAQGEQDFHRATRDDFVDKAANENSLWDGQGQNNYLFANNRRRETGDVLSADVEKELRREIQYQLWMNLPPEQRKIRRKPASGAADAASDSVTNAAAAAQKDANGNPIPGAAKPPQGAEAKAKDAAEEAAKQNMSPTGPGDDIIRMEVVENMGNGLMRVLGQKRVVYRGVSRVVEVAALVNNKDIDDANHTKSSSFLDMKAQVIQ
jgi:flagellar basal body L-ring protein FlgH